MQYMQLIGDNFKIKFLMIEVLVHYHNIFFFRSGSGSDWYIRIQTWILLEKQDKVRRHFLETGKLRGFEYVEAIIRKKLLWNFSLAYIEAGKLLNWNSLKNLFFLSIFFFPLLHLLFPPLKIPLEVSLSIIPCLFSIVDSSLVHSLNIPSYFIGS